MKNITKILGIEEDFTNHKGRVKFAIEDFSDDTLKERRYRSIEYEKIKLGEPILLGNAEALLKKEISREDLSEVYRVSGCGITSKHGIYLAMDVPLKNIQKTIKKKLSEERKNYILHLKELYSDPTRYPAGHNVEGELEE